MLSHSAITARLNKVFRDVFDDETIEVTDDMTAADVEGWDSLAHIRLVLAVEKEFHIRLKAAEIGNLAFAKDMIEIIHKTAKE